MSEDEKKPLFKTIEKSPIQQVLSFSRQHDTGKKLLEKTEKGEITITTDPEDYFYQSVPLLDLILWCAPDRKEPLFNTGKDT